jgi:hypothetical protein
MSRSLLQHAVGVPCYGCLRIDYVEGGVVFAVQQD